MHPSTLNLPEIEKIGIPRKISSISLYDQASLAFAQDSILPSISRFINSINNMNHVIMIPSKLHDFECEEAGDLNDAKSVASDEGSLTSSSSVSSNLLNLANSNPEHSSLTGATSLYDSYRMLIQAKDDVLWGFSKDEKLNSKPAAKEVDQNNNSVSAAKEDTEKENKTAEEDLADNQIINQFRSNIQQLNSLLNNFSEMADYLTNKYKTVYEN